MYRITGIPQDNSSTFCRHQGGSGTDNLRGQDPTGLLHDSFTERRAAIAAPA
jgi:hypothetical protein